MSSIQSVPGQPEAAPDSTPRHHGAVALDLSVVMSCCRPSHVVGALELKSPTTLGSYQMRPLTAVLMNTPIDLPLTWPSWTSAGAVSDV